MDSIIFDLDGTLWNSVKSITEIWNQVIRDRGYGKYQLTQEDVQGVMGMQGHEIAAKFFPDLDQESQLALMEACFEEEIPYVVRHGGVLYPKVKETLDKLCRRYPLFIVSNCQDGYIEAFFHYTGLGGYFRDYENPGRTGLSKGDNILLIMDRNQLKSPVYVGDTEGDYRAAKAAGIPFVYASYGFGNPQGWQHRIETFAQLASLFL